MSKWPKSARVEVTKFGNLPRSQLMARIGSRSNQTTDATLARLLRQYRLRGWRRQGTMIGKPDFIWPDRKIALFVDGCFWHGHNCRNLTPATNASAWSEKLARNRKRDRNVTRRLHQIGWRVIRIWECSLSKSPRRCLARIERALTKSPIRT